MLMDLQCTGVAQDAAYSHCRACILHVINEEIKLFKHCRVLVGDGDVDVGRNMRCYTVH